MDVFAGRDQIIDDHRSFTTASIDIKDLRLKDYYQSEMDRGRQWSEPWLSLNPAFDAGSTSWAGMGCSNPSARASSA